MRRATAASKPQLLDASAGTVDARRLSAMVPIQHILVATDFCAASARALEVATEIATRFGAKITVMHAIEPIWYGRTCSVPPEVHRSAAFRLDETVRSVRSQVPTLVEGLLREGFAWQEITQAATEIGAGLVVVGTHGRYDVDRFLIGSVAEKVVRLCAVPVLTVHAWRFKDRRHAGRELAELLLRSGEQVTTVVALSRGGAIVGAEVAEAFGAPLHVLLTRGFASDGPALGPIGEPEAALRDEKGTRIVCERGRIESGPIATSSVTTPSANEPAWVKDAGAGTVLLVSDAILAAGPPALAAQGLRRSGARRIVAASPAASVAAQGALRRVVDEVVVVQSFEGDGRLERFYPDTSDPDDRAVLERLAATAQWAHAVEKRP